MSFRKIGVSLFRFVIFHHIFMNDHSIENMLHMQAAELQK